MNHSAAPSRREHLSRESVVLLSVLGATLLLKLVYLVYYAQRVPYYGTPMGDSLIYLDWARNIIGGDFWGLREQFQVFYRAPLYPYLLAGFLKVFGGSLLPVYIFQLLLGVANLYLTYRITRRLFSHTAGIVAVVLAALYAPLVFKETKLVSVTLTIAFGLLSVWFLLKSQDGRPRLHWLLAGVFAGLATLTWGGGIVMLPVVFVLWLLLRPRPRLELPVLLGLGWFAVILPVTLHNVLIGNDWVLINSNSGYTFYQGNNPAASGTIVHPPEVYERTYNGRFPT
ncbi:glycosyltransferase family 39 protein, partial [candidate division WOR-3 bacterium]|nr:glycosyltransferase family 39 protein [candidate division WOR-3 bacterium]